MERSKVLNIIDVKQKICIVNKDLKVSVMYVTGLSTDLKV